mmetsp:Transcript_145734/g.369972  ORF Transcript_145734/g.369972 Transcript_145734/m.369972 type:complete len:1195 (-) Transcript_145734:30-3614(-)
MWPRPPVTERRDPDGHQTRVGYILRRCGFERHCGIVTRICLAKGGQRGEATTVLTASRDGTLKCWDVPAASETLGGTSSSAAPPPAQLRCSLEEHTGWVNDCVVLPQMSSAARASGDSRRLVSASNDNLVKVWQVEEERQGAGVTAALMSLRYHIDYVTCLAYAPHRALLSSAGLDSRVVVTDLEAATRVLTLQGSDGEPYGGVASGGLRSSSNGPGTGRGSPGSSPQLAAVQHCTVGQFSGSGQYIPQLLLPPGSQATGRDSPGYEHGRGGGWEQESSSGSSSASVWSLAATRNASLLVCGTASNAVRGWDPRSGTRLWRLRGHTENVRALVLSDDGTICISGSGDRTVRVWDLGMRRCIHVFDAHHDSVWALAVAGRSCGYASQGADAAGAGGALSEVFSGGRDGLLLSHDLRQMQTGLVAREPSPLQAIAAPLDASDLWASAGDSHVRRHAVLVTPVPYSGVPAPTTDAVPPPGAAPISPVPALPPAAADDCITLQGTPRLTDYKVLDNKRQVLVRDACDQFSLWDVTNGQCIDVPAPPAPKDAAGATDSTPPAPGTKAAEELMKRAFMLVNRPVSVPNWFSCDISLGSLSVYLDVGQCFKAEPDEADAAPAQPGGAGTLRNPGWGGGGADAVPAAINLGIRTLRALFESWVRAPLSGAAGRGAERGLTNPTDRASGRSQSPAARGRPLSAARPRVFVAPPALQDASGGRRWDDDQPPGTPTDQQPGGGAVAAEATAGVSSSSSAFPPATALVLVSRNGRPVGYRGRLYCGLFSASESPDLLPPWVVDVVWNQMPPPEELCGERALVFSLLRCPSELALPALPTPYCVAAPRTRVRRLMVYLVRALDFDWSAPANVVARRPSSAVSLVSRLGRCCVAPGGARGGARSTSSDSWGSQSDGGDALPTNHGGSHGTGQGGGGHGDGNGSGGGVRDGSGRGGSSSARRSRGSKRDRPSSFSGSQASRSNASSAGSRRHFGLRGRGEEDISGPSGVVGRVHIDGSPSPLPSVPAGVQQGGGSGRNRSSGAAASLPTVAGVSPGSSATAATVPPDERCVEILCNGAVMDPEMSLATVLDFIWKKPSAELVLMYRRASRSTASILPQSSSKDAASSSSAVAVGAASGGAVAGGGGAAGTSGSGTAGIGEDGTSELRLGGAEAAGGGAASAPGAWGNGQGDSQGPAEEGMRGPGTAPKE